MVGRKPAGARGGYHRMVDSFCTLGARRIKEAVPGALHMRTLPLCQLAVSAALAGAAAVAVAQTPASESLPADTLLVNGEIYRADGGWAQAVAIRHGVIVAVGDAGSVQRFKGANTKVIDLAGQAVLPGLHDMHIHPLGAGLMLKSCMLKREATPEEIRATVGRCAAKAKPGEWITGGSWVAEVFKTEPQDRKLLDEAAPENPVVLSDETGHSAWANSRALKIAGIAKGTPNPLNGAIEHRPDGEPNGVLREAAANLVRSQVPAGSGEENAAALKLALQTILATGITSLQDAVANQQTMTAFTILADRGELKQRVKECIHWTYNATGVDSSFEALYSERALFRRDRLEPNCVKIVNDGVPGEGHTAAMLAPYAGQVSGDVGDTRKFGFMNTPPDVLKKMVTRFDRDGMSMLIHCTGDACARAAVDAVAAARKANGWSGRLHQIGHNDFTTSQDLKQGRQLGVTFEYSAYLYYWNGVTRTYLKAIGPQRFERFKPVRETIDDGAIALEGRIGQFHRRRIPGLRSRRWSHARSPEAATMSRSHSRRRSLSRRRSISTR